jgi:hypothetical protein
MNTHLRAATRRLSIACAASVVTLAMPGLTTAAPPGAVYWAKAGSYYPGMQKEAAKKVGLKGCTETTSIVRCAAAAPLQLGGSTSTSSEIELDRKSGRLQAVTFRFLSKDFEAVSAALIKQHGEPTAKDDDYRARDWQRRGYGSCGPVFLWHRGGDDVLVVCGGSWRRSGVTTVVAERVPGRGKEWSEVAAGHRASKAKANSFNSE